MKIYTKQGDKGHTRLVGGSKVGKNHERVEAYGCIDELNSVIGLAVLKCTSSALPEALEKMAAFLLHLQSELFVVGGILACEDTQMLAKLPKLPAQCVEALEKQIDAMDQHLEPLKNFILPGGHEIACLLHLARTTCRRAERRCVELLMKTSSAPSELELCVTYLNRLSDYLFTAARFSNKHMGEKDRPWVHS